MRTTSFEAIKNLIKQYDSPLYVFDEKSFAENYQKLYRAMAAYYGKYRIAYSFKTNYTPYICKCAKSLGAYAEVVSGMEYILAKKIGYSDQEIIFNGPDKGQEGIRSFLAGSMVNADSLDEVAQYCTAAQNNSQNKYKIGFRVNLNIGQNFVSRFGMDEDDLEAAFRMVGKINNLSVAGLHCHISRCRGIEAWRKRADFMLQLADRFFDRPPEYIDLGSGMFGSMADDLAKQFDDIPSYEEYAEATAGMFAEHYRGQEGPILFTEPGTTLINRFVETIAQVTHIKKIRDHYFAVLNAGEHILGETCTLKQLPIRVIPGGEIQQLYKKIDLTGYTCLEQDILFREFSGELAKGDIVIFENTGGYSNVLKPPFIRPGCAMVAETNGNTFLLIKEAESFDDIFRTYVLED